MKAILKNYNQSPRKVRLLADLVRGKTVDEASTLLMHADKKAASAVRKLLMSAVANAKTNFNKNEIDLFVKEIRVDKGMQLKRFRPGWRGVAWPMTRKKSLVTIVLDEKSLSPKVKPTVVEK